MGSKRYGADSLYFGDILIGEDHVLGTKSTPFVY